MEERNRRIIGAEIEREKKICPGALALIGVYGSFATGDVHPRSDLDLLIVINDSRGWALGEAFLQEDLQIGHDLYCTTWESLRQDAERPHPHIAKLMDAKIVYCAEEKHRETLEALRRQARAILDAPFGQADLARAEEEWNQARQCFAQAVTAEGLSERRRQAGGAVYFLENAVALLNKTYFRRGVRRRYAELQEMPKRPENLCGMIESVAAAEDADALLEALTRLMRETEAVFRRERQALAPAGKRPDPKALAGTYEEMVSNWRGKMRLAAETGDRHLALMSLVSLDAMLMDIGEETCIARRDVLAAYDPRDLEKTERGFDAVLADYLEEYRRAGAAVKRYPDIDAFLADYAGQGPDA